jgi:hypothetical protein
MRGFPNSRFLYDGQHHRLTCLYCGTHINSIKIKEPEFEDYRYIIRCLGQANSVGDVYLYLASNAYLSTPLLFVLLSPPEEGAKLL